MKKTSEPLAWAVWATAWGPMGAVRSAAGICRVVLPGYQPDDLRALLEFEHPGAREQPEGFAELIELSRSYFNGQKVDFAAIACDLPAPGSFRGKVLRACRSIPYGQTRSYAWLADAAAAPQGPRAAAGVMSRNPLPLVVPCHRVIYATGRLGGFSAPGGVDLKRRLLALEGVL